MLPHGPTPRIGQQLPAVHYYSDNTTDPSSFVAWRWELLFLFRWRGLDIGMLSFLSGDGVTLPFSNRWEAPSRTAARGAGSIARLLPAILAILKRLPSTNHKCHSIPRMISLMSYPPKNLPQFLCGQTSWNAKLQQRTCDRYNIQKGSKR